jgi:hypothetical protein
MSPRSRSFARASASALCLLTAIACSGGGEAESEGAGGSGHGASGGEGGGRAQAGGTTQNTAGGTFGNGGLGLTSGGASGGNLAGGAANAGGGGTSNNPAKGGTSSGGSNTGGAQSTAGTANVGGGGGKASSGGMGNGGVAGRSATGGATSGGSAAGGNVSASGGTASGGTASGGTASGGNTSTTSCNVTPVTKNASPQAKNLLCYLYSIYGKGVLSGQQETSWSDPASDISWYMTNVGKSPAILGGDYLYDTSTTTRALAYWQAGGISMMRYHMGMPPNADSYENSQLTPGSGLLDQVVTPGNANYTSFVGKLDYVATELQRMKTANAPVLLALFHEYQPGGWFWWSKGSAAQFTKLWTFTFDYLTNTKGLNNIVWLAPSSGSPNASWLPGKAYYDIAGPDTYATNQPFTSLFGSAKSIVGATVPIALHETGMVPQPSNMFPTAAPWVLWNIWAGYQRDTSKNQLSAIQSAYSSSYTITRDEVPNLK